MWEKKEDGSGERAFSHFPLFFCPKTRIIPHFPRFFSSKLLFSSFFYLKIKKIANFTTSIPRKHLSDVKCKSLISRF